MRRVLALLGALLLPGAGALSAASLQAAATYSAAHRGSALVVWQGGQAVFRQAQGGFDLTQSHLLASGSKSFGCAIAAALTAQGRLNLDERASDTLTEWRSNPAKRTITVRQLLSFTSGLPGQTGSVLPRTHANLYAEVLRLPLRAAPGTAFSYGNTHLSAFAELVRRKTQLDPGVYLQRAVLDPLGVRATWAADRAGNSDLTGGAQLTADDWARYGQLMLQGGQWKGQRLLPAGSLRECLRGSSALNAYGLTWWLNVPFEGSLDAGDDVPVQAFNADVRGAGQFAPSAERSMFMAAGTRNQRLYVLPERQLVIVRFGEGGPWSDEAFLSRLLAP